MRPEIQLKNTVTRVMCCRRERPENIPNGPCLVAGPWEESIEKSAMLALSRGWMMSGVFCPDQKSDYEAMLCPECAKFLMDMHDTKPTRHHLDLFAMSIAAYFVFRREPYTIFDHVLGDKMLDALKYFVGRFGGFSVMDSENEGFKVKLHRAGESDKVPDGVVSSGGTVEIHEAVRCVSVFSSEMCIKWGGWPSPKSDYGDRP